MPVVSVTEAIPEKFDENNNENTILHEKLEELETKCNSQDLEIHLLKLGLSQAFNRITSFEEAFARITALEDCMKESEKTLSDKTSSQKQSNRVSSSNVTKKARSKSFGKSDIRTKDRLTNHVTNYVTNTKPTDIASRRNVKLKPDIFEIPNGNPVKAKAKKVYTRRAQSAELPKTVDDGKPKLILAKRPSSPRKRFSSNSSNEMKLPNETSPREDHVKFSIRGRMQTYYVPSDYQEDKDTGNAPDQKLQLQWVYGYRGKDSRDNLFLLSSGELVYNMAGVIVLYNVKTNTQRHYVEHTDDVKCVSVHQNGEYIASGQVAGHGDGGKPHVRVWNSNTLQTISVFGEGMFERAVTCVEFLTLEGGIYLVALDDSNAVYIYNWEKATLMAEGKGSKDPIFGVKCNPVSELSFVTYGKSHLAFWKMEYLEAKSKHRIGLGKKLAIYDKVDKPKYALCVIFNQKGDVVTGDSNGNILLYALDVNRSSLAALSAHKGGVVNLLYHNDEIVSCGKDGNFSLWNNNLEKMRDFGTVDEQYGFVRTIVYNTAENNYFIGTSKNCILQFDNELLNSQLAIQGHCDEMWGLATHPTSALFVTCSQDNLVCIWDGTTQNNIWAYHIDDKAKSAVFHPYEKYVIVGTYNGKLYLLNYEIKEEIITLPVSRDVIDDIKISPDCNYMAVACRDTNIYLYNMVKDDYNFKKPKVLQGHSSRVLHIDWSRDSEYVQSNSGDYEMLYWQAESGLQILSPAALRDVEWVSWTCPFGFSAMGVWPEGADGTDINACDRSNNKAVIATGDDFGEVKLFKYPSVKLKSDSHVGAGHSSHVTCVRFLHHDNELVTVGGQDCSVMQWKLVPVPPVEN